MAPARLLWKMWGFEEGAFLIKVFRLVRQIVLDKTGTLTEGRPVVREIETVDGSEQQLLAIAAAAEASSEHPLAQAVVEAAFARGATPPDVQSFDAFPGKGVHAI